MTITSNNEGYGFHSTAFYSALESITGSVDDWGTDAQRAKAGELAAVAFDRVGKELIEARFVADAAAAQGFLDSRGGRYLADQIGRTGTICGVKWLADAVRIEGYAPRHRRRAA